MTTTLYCATCGYRLTEEMLEVGRGVLLPDGRAFCAGHAPAMPEEPVQPRHRTSRLRAVASKKSSGSLRAAPQGRGRTSRVHSVAKSGGSSGKTKSASTVAKVRASTRIRRAPGPSPRLAAARRVGDVAVVRYGLTPVQTAVVLSLMGAVLLVGLALAIS